MSPTRRCDVENLVDFSRYYYGSYVGLPKDTAIYPMLVGSSPADNVIFLRKMSKDQNGAFSIGEYEAWSFDSIKESIDFGCPKSSVCSYKGQIVYPTYPTPREPRKGLRIEEATIVELNSWGSNIRSGRYNNACYDLIWNIFNPNYVRFSEAWNSLKEGSCVGVPISRTLGLFTTKKHSTPLVSHKKWVIGYAPSESLICVGSAYSEYSKGLEEQTRAKVCIV